MSKEVKVFSTRDNRTQVFTVDDNVTTFSELKAAISGVEFSGMKVVVKETRNTLESGNAQLPSGNFTLYLFPEKVKSGFGSDQDGDEENLEHSVVAAIRAMQRRINNIIDEAVEDPGFADEVDEESVRLAEDVAQARQELGI
jgi:hypothetical protein